MTLTAIHIDELIEKCRQGDQRAQMEVYNKYSKAMYNTSLRIVKHAAEAEDIMQECFLKAFQKLDSFEGNSTFGAWLKKIVVNQSINAYRNKVKNPEVEFDSMSHASTPAQDGLITEESPADPRVRKLIRSMGELKENYRIILTLHLIEGYDYEEITDILGITYANCRTTVSRAKESLRKKIMNYEN